MLNGILYDFEFRKRDYFSHFAPLYRRNILNSKEAFSDTRENRCMVINLVEVIDMYPL